MQASDLTKELKKETLAPLWLVTGDEPLVMIEAIDAIRSRARSLGYEEREVLNASANWDWNHVFDACQAMSLFASQKIVELRLASPRPGTKGAEVLAALANAPLEGVILIVSIPYDWSIEKLAWYKKLKSAATVVECPTVGAKDLPRWFTERFKAQNQTVESAALTLLTQRCEGNLLAAKQELLKLSYQYPAGETITLEMIEKSVSDVSRFDEDNLIEAAMTADAAKAVRILNNLKAQGVAIPSFLWVLTDEIRMAARAKSLMDSGMDFYGALTKAGVYGADKKRRVTAAIRRCGAKKLASALMLCASIDKQAKGLVVKNRDSDPWVELESLVSFLAK